MIWTGDKHWQFRVWNAPKAFALLCLVGSSLTMGCDLIGLGDLPVCGDGLVSQVEECDDGNEDPGDNCTNNCQLSRCGDGIVHSTEESCDDGNDDEGDACSNDCQRSCGDGMTEGPEECDDGNDSNNDRCLNDCLDASCGDGFAQDRVELCDDGNDSNNDGCLNNCVEAFCGDRTLWSGVEACDDGNDSNHDACLNDCTEATCGDGFVRAGVEACDDGNSDDTDSCLNNCRAARCGDGVIGPGEGCDDGNDDPTDDCVACQPASCGDAVTQNNEECDDGNLDDTDECTSACTRARCGDGFQRMDLAEGEAGFEACDDGNQINTDGCLNHCVPASCGDGVVWNGVETCDDGNFQNWDGCDGRCRREVDHSDTPEGVTQDSALGCCVPAGVSASIHSVNDVDYFYWHAGAGYRRYVFETFGDLDTVCSLQPMFGPGDGRPPIAAIVDDNSGGGSNCRISECLPVNNPDTRYWFWVRVNPGSPTGWYMIRTHTSDDPC